MFDKKRSDKLSKKMDKAISIFQKLKKEMSDIVTEGTKDVVKIKEEKAKLDIEQTSVEGVINAAKENLELIPDFKTVEKIK